MNYSANSQKRRLRHRLNILIGRLGFNVLHLSPSERITAIGIVIVIVACFLPWFALGTDGSADGSLVRFWAFSLASGYVGFVFLLIIVVLAFLIISDRNKERFKTRIPIPVHDHTLIVFAGILISLLSLTVFHTIRAYTTFFAQVQMEGGSAVAFTGGIIIMIGGLLAYREERQELLKRIYMENSQSVDSALEEYRDILGSTGKSENMKLPV